MASLALDEVPSAASSTFVKGLLISELTNVIAETCLNIARLVETKLHRFVDSCLRGGTLCVPFRLDSAACVCASGGHSINVQYENVWNSSGWASIVPGCSVCASQVTGSDFDATIPRMAKILIVTNRCRF